MPVSNSLITIVDSSGNSIVVPVASAIPAGGVMVAGSDGTNARFLSTDTSGRLVVIGQGVAGTPAGGVVSIQGVAGGTAVPISGSITATNPSVSTTGSAPPASATYIGGNDGTNLVGFKMKPASTAAVAADPSLVVAISPNTPAKIWDGTNTAAVKAASTAAVATDPALVVAISPNNPISVSGTADVTATGALGALNATVQVASAGLETVGIQLAAGTLTGTLVPEMSFDGGTTWNSTYFDTPSTQKVASLSVTNPNGAAAAAITCVGGAGLYRVRVSAYTSGTANATLRATTGGGQSVMFIGPANQTVPQAIAFVGGSDGTNLVPFKVKPASTAAVAADPSLVVALSPNTPAKVWDGTNTVAVKAASTAPLATDPALVVTISPNSGSLSNPSVGTTGTAVPASATFIGGTDGTNLVALTVKPANTAALATDPSLVVAISPNSPSLFGYLSTSYSPNIGNVVSNTTGQVAIDASSRMETHSSVTTDEGSFRDDFSGSSLTTALTGTVNFTNGSTAVTGSGTLFTTQIRSGDWIKKSADAETFYVEVSSVDSDTALTLMSPYGGTTAGAASVVSGWSTNTAATGGSITVANSIVSIVLGTTNGQTSYIQRNGDYGPYSFLTYLAVSQRIANQTVAVGFRDNWGAPNKRCEIQFTGTDNTKVNFVTASGSAAADIQTTTVSLPNLGVTSGYHTYKIDLVGNQAMLQIDGVVVATNTTHLPGPYDLLSIMAGIVNTGTAGSSTTLNVDSLFFYNTNQIQINTDFQGKPMAIKAVDGATLPVFLTDATAAPAWPTPFGDLRVVTPWVLADLVNKYEIDPRVYGTSTATGGTVTYVPLQSAVNLAATATSGSSAKLRTNNYFRYQAGKSLRWRTTLYHSDTGQTNQVRRWGFFDDNDGLFFALTGTTVSVVQRSSVSGGVVEVVVPQSSWNFDRMDGYGPSGLTLDITKGNIYECAFQWLGVGNVQFFVNGRLVHINRNPGVYAAPYMRTATLPLSWEVVNTGASTIGGFTYICSNVFVEGGEPAAATSFAAFTAADILTSPAEHPIISIRPKATYNSITNRMLLLPFLLSVSTEGSRAGFRVVMNSTLTGASWVSADSNSGAEYDISATSGTGGQTLLRGFLPGSNDAKDVDLSGFFSEKAHGRSLHLDAFASTQDVLTVYAVNEGLGNTNIRASLAWNEIR